MIKRVFLVVLDSFGVGAMPDAAEFGDEGCSTIRSVSKSPKLKIPNLISMGLGNIEGAEIVGSCKSPLGAYGRMSELSKGKDTTTGHWEIAGVVSERPMPTFPNGFPREITDRLSRMIGRGILCNEPYSGTEVIRDYGEEHLRTGDIILYTSADSVFQVAAHEEKIPLTELYEICGTARKLLTGKYAVGRVIARPFAGAAPEFYRTESRRDFSLEPPEETLLDRLSQNGMDVIGVGKISDIFAGRGITQSFPVHGNSECEDALEELLEKDFCGLCFVNLVDFDMVYGHRNDINGYAAALSEFDFRLSRILPKLGSDDMLIITADHGCDPGDTSTDHTREYVPLLVYGEKIRPTSLGTQKGFSTLAASVAEMLGVGGCDKYAVSFYGGIKK